MEWILILGLIVMAIIQSERLRALKRRLDDVQRRLDALTQLKPEPEREEAWAAPAPANETLPELLLTDVVTEDTALAAPRASVPEPTPAPSDQPELVLTRVAKPDAAAAPLRAQRRMAAEQWLSQKGFAWLGGALAAFGGVFIVAYASKQGWFTPTLRLSAALIVGIALIAASEWIRRKRNLLVAALIAGAGAATLYAAAWGAYGLYKYVEWPTAAAALAACSLIFLGLALLHGEALGAVAIVAALLAPPLTTLIGWPPLTLSIYLGAVIAGGFGAAALRRWGWVAAVTTLGAYVWFADFLAAGQSNAALIMLALAALGATALYFRTSTNPAETGAPSWPNAQAYLPSLALGLSALLAPLCWSNSAPNGLVGPALTGMALVTLGALGVRARAVRPAAVLAAIAGLALGVFVAAREVTTSSIPSFYVWALSCAAACALSALAASAQREDRDLLSGFGAFGSLIIVVLATLVQPNWSAAAVWAPLAISAVLLAPAAETAARRGQHPHEDVSVDLWAAAGATALILAIESFAFATSKPPAMGAAALIFAAWYLARGWRAAAGAAVVAAALTLGHALAGDFWRAAWIGALPLSRALTTIAASALFVAAAAWLVRRREPRAQSAEALGSAAILAVLFGLFLALHAYASASARLDSFTENAVRALALISAGYIAIPRRRANSMGVIARWRGHVLMMAGLLLAFTACGVRFNPWWGPEPALISGPRFGIELPLINVLTLAFAGPAALSFAAAERVYRRQLDIARAYVLMGVLFGALWVVLELRHAFHHTLMFADAPVRLLEGDLYALAALAAASTHAIWARRRSALTGMDERPFTHDLVRSTSISAFAAILVSALLLLGLRNAWWGGFPALDMPEAGLATLAQAPAALFALVIALELPARAHRARFVAVSAALMFTLTFGVLLIRWAHHPSTMAFEDMRGDEGPLLSIWPLALLFAVGALAPRLARREMWRESALDACAISAAGLWPTLAFSGFGLWALFNPWRGLFPAQMYGPFTALLALACYLGAAALAIAAGQLAIVRRDAYFGHAAKIAAVIHLFATATLIVRWLYHGPDMATGVRPEGIETWSYSALWAVSGALVLAAGAVRRDAILRWSAIVILIGVSLKVVLFDTSQLDGMVRAASFLVVASVLVAVALASRRANRSRIGTAGE